MNISELGGHPEKHWGVKELSSKYPWQFQTYFKFSVVRNPWERVVSWVAYRDKRFGRVSGTFEQRMWLDLNDDNFVHTLREKSYWNMLFLNGKLAVDHVIRMEKLQEGIDVVLDTVGKPRASLPHCNRTGHNQYAKYYEEKTRSKVSRIFAADIEIFGYSFDDSCCR